MIDLVRYSAATATFTVLAMGKGVLPLMLTVSPLSSDRAPQCRRR